MTDYTGFSNLVLDTLWDYYNKHIVCSKKIEVDLFSVYPDISFHSNKSEKITEIS